MSRARAKVLVAMSGGVDSSVAAALLVREGFEVVGCFMRLGSPGETVGRLLPAGEACGPADGPPGVAQAKIGHQGCCSIADAADARLVAAELGIPLYVCNFKREFGRVIDYFVDEYARGRTPNPCVRCNDWLKFGALHASAQQIDAQAVASGHYARIEPGQDAAPRLRRGRDRAKDQSYVLFGLPREQLEHTLLPIGALEKAEVRDLARRFGLPVFDKPDSQEICFVPDNDYAALVERQRPELAQAGAVVDTQGRQIGAHDGHHRYTIGQRRGLNLAVGQPLYVLSKDPASNAITVGPREALGAVACEVSEANWLVEAPFEAAPPDGLVALAQVRAHAVPVAARITPLDPSREQTPSGRRGRFAVRFERPLDAVTPGQALVLYSAEEPDVVLGGGWIESASGPAST